MNDQKYALFEIKTEDEKTVYLYCSDVESSEVKINNLVDNFYGIFGDTDHVSISVIACDTEKVTDMKFMFSRCSSLTELDLKNFNTTNVTDMRYMFYGCSELKKINFGQNFNTTNVTNMNNMFDWCSSFPEDIRNKLNNVEGIIDFFKEKNN